jgi:hypothetical protein
MADYPSICCFFLLSRFKISSFLLYISLIFITPLVMPAQNMSHDVLICALMFGMAACLRSSRPWT